METLYFPRGPARQPGSSGMAGALQLSNRGGLLLRYGSPSGLAADRKHTTGHFRRLCRCRQKLSDLAGNLFSAVSDVSCAQCLLQYRLSSGDFCDPSFAVRQHFLSATASGLPVSAGNMWGMDHDFLSIQFPVHPDSGLSERQLLLVQRLHVLHRFLCRDPVFPGHIASLPVQWEKDTDASASPVRNFLRRWQLRVPSPLHAVCGNRNLSTAVAEK